MLQSTQQGMNLYLTIGISSRDELQHLCAGRLRLFLTICHTRRIMPFWLVCLTALVVCSLVAADPAAITGQKSTWQYAIEWRLVHAGTARLTWTPEPSAFQADLHIESAGFVSKLYRVNDDYRARMGEQFCASTVTIHAEEGKRRRDTNITFAEGKASYSERDLIKNTVLTRETPIPACVHEYFGALQRLRTPSTGDWQAHSGAA